MFLFDRENRGSGTTTEQFLALVRIQHLSQGLFHPAAQMLPNTWIVHPKIQPQGYSAQCHKYDLSREVTFSMFTLTVSHSQLDLDWLRQTDPSPSNFKEVVKTCQLPAACSLPTVVAQQLHRKQSAGNKRNIYMPLWEYLEMLLTWAVTCYLQRENIAVHSVFKDSFYPHWGTLYWYSVD